MAFAVTDTTTCTACAGTMLLEFAALSRATGNPEYEARAHRAMEVLWQRRHLGHNLVGTTINVHNGEWTRKGAACVCVCVAAMACVCLHMYCTWI